MANEELIQKAKELGIENAESLNKTQLTKAISVKEKEIKKSIDDRAALVERAVELGFDSELLDEFSNEKLEEAITEAEEERAAKELESKKAEFISEFLDIDFTASTLEEVSEAAKVVIEKAVSSVKSETTSEAVVKSEEGKTTDHFETENGIKYVFDEEAPEAFRFADVLKTQKEWLEDKDAMELMIQGGVGYIKPLIN